jgi:hypothetical protein
MYENRKEPVFDLPVPGMGMTHELGARPWQQPAQYNNVDEVTKFYIGKMQDEAFVEQTLNLLETKMPVTMISNAMQVTGVMNGVHTIDTGMLVLPVIMEMIMLIADTEGVEYTTGVERNIDDELDNTRLDVAVEQYDDVMLNKEKKQEQIEEEDMQIEEVLQTGLMSRRVK